jgi:hypothetical protein
MNELFLCQAVWGFMIALAFVLKAVVDKRCDPEAVEKRYQAQRYMQHWNRWGLAIKGETISHFDPTEFDHIERG